VSDDQQPLVRVTNSVHGTAGRYQAPAQREPDEVLSAAPAEARISAPAAAAPPSAAPEHVATVNGAGSHATAANDGVAVRRYNQGSSLTQSLQTCLAQGVSLDPNHLGCSPQ
jgi:hypothetical protein